jgi:uncharacterized delta-60 repeat protein
MTDRRLPALAGLPALAAALAALALAAPAPAAAASPGSLDPTWDGSGLVGLGQGTELFGVAVQSDGEVVAAGESGGQVLVVRYNAAGAPAGQYLGPGGVARAVAIQPDGKIVIAGKTDSGAMLVQRLTSSLQPDSSFGSGRSVQLFGGQNGVANGVAIGPDGSIVAVGTVGGPNTAFAAAKLSSNGSGIWGESFDPYGLPYSTASAVAVQSDGAIVIAGNQQGSPTYGFFNGLVVRLTPGGALDGSFNGSGVVSYHYPGGGYTALNAVAIQTDGRIVVAGADAGGPNAVFLRLNANGSFDSGFGPGGVAALPSGRSTNTGDPIGARGVVIAGGGAIVGAGNYENTGSEVDAALWALNSGGQPEGTFGSGGTVRAPTPEYEACALAIAPDGSLLAAGNTVTANPDGTPCQPSPTAAGFLARYIGYGPPPSGPSTAAPTVTTGGASGVGETSALVSGAVNPGGLQTSYRFEYGISQQYGRSSASGMLGAGTASVGVSAQLTGLQPGTTYHYRLVASNGDGTVDGADGTFKTTPARPPTATSGRASAVGEVSARLSGTIDTGGLQTSYRFQYGKKSSYGSGTKSTTLAANAGTTGVAVTLRNLRPGTVYHYRLVASNADGGSDGADRTFKTAPRLGVHVSVSRAYSLSAVEQQGLPISASCTQACTVRDQLVISAATARQLGLGTHKLVIGTGARRLARGASGVLVLHLKPTEEPLLAGLRNLQVTLQIVFSPAGGGPAVKRSRSVTLTG